MLSRVSRMTSLSSQVIGGCTLLRDAPTAPKVVPKVTEEHHFLNDHAAYCRFNPPLRSRSSNSGTDPFLGVGPGNVESLTDLFDHGLFNAFSPNDRSSLTDLLPVPADLKPVDDWMEHFGPLSIPSDEDASIPPIQSGDDVEHASGLVDWQAWDSYLGLETRELDEMKLEPQDDDYPAYRDEDYKCEPFEPDGAMVPEVKTEIKEEPIDDPTPEATTQPSYSRTRAYRKATARMWTSFNLCANTLPVKKRGVVLKPRVDDATDRRRAMNRIAALRYRERKRQERLEFCRKFNDLERRNATLKRQERKLQAEVAKFRRQLTRMGAL